MLQLDFKFSENQIKYYQWRLYYDSIATKCAFKYLSTYKSYGNLKFWLLSSKKDSSILLSGII